MKIFFKSLFLISSLSLFSLPALSQNKSEDYQKIIETAYKKLSSVSYRLKSLKRIGNGFSGSDTKIVFEVVTPDKSNEIKTTEYLTDDGEANKPDKIQTIIIGKKKFVKIDAENWKEINETEEAKLKSPFNDYLSLKNLTYPVKDLVIETAGQENINGLKTDVYKAIYTADKRIYEVSYWIAANGLLIKAEYKVNFKSWTIGMTENYEYNTNFKIEAPNLN
jgi:hypothetical protein